MFFFFSKSCGKFVQSETNSEPLGKNNLKNKYEDCNKGSRMPKVTKGNCSYTTNCSFTSLAKQITCSAL